MQHMHLSCRASITVMRYMPMFRLVIVDDNSCRLASQCQDGQYFIKITEFTRDDLHWLLRTFESMYISFQFHYYISEFIIRSTVVPRRRDCVHQQRFILLQHHIKDNLLNEHLLSQDRCCGTLPTIVRTDVKLSAYLRLLNVHLFTIAFRDYFYVGEYRSCNFFFCKSQLWNFL